MNYVGIDPGKTGAMAILWEETGTFHAPEVVDFKDTVWQEIPNYPPNTRVYIEAVHAMPGQGVTGMFNFGMNFGWWRGALDAIGHKYVLVTPQAWKKHFGLIGKSKDDARILAIELFPRIKDQLSRKKDCGRADALLIARYGMEKYK